jgi:hypothetical protein
MSYAQLLAVLLAESYVIVGVPGVEGAPRLDRITFDPTSDDVPAALVAVANALK